MSTLGSVLNLRYIWLSNTDVPKHGSLTSAKVCRSRYLNSNVGFSAKSSTCSIFNPQTTNFASIKPSWVVRSLPSMSLFLLAEESPHLKSDLLSKQGDPWKENLLNEFNALWYCTLIGSSKSNELNLLSGDFPLQMLQTGLIGRVPVVL